MYEPKSQKVQYRHNHIFLGCAFGRCRYYIANRKDEKSTPEFSNGSAIGYKRRWRPIPISPIARIVGHTSARVVCGIRSRMINAFGVKSGR
jgi:hypothetical protein